MAITTYGLYHLQVELLELLGQMEPLEHQEVVELLGHQEVVARLELLEHQVVVEQVV